MTVRQRIVQIRRLVAAVAVTLFIALFSAIYVQMASGNDPALGSSSSTATATPSSSSDNSGSSADVAPTGVTTRQS
ncbi:MAG TPA: hypothetical protein VI006_13180 [Solirubrobacteraceae bacterium]|jgi:hypothetical protein